MSLPAAHNSQLYIPPNRTRLQSYNKKIKPQRESAILFLIDAICLTLSGFYNKENTVIFLRFIFFKHVYCIIKTLFLGSNAFISHCLQFCFRFLLPFFFTLANITEPIHHFFAGSLLVRYSHSQLYYFTKIFRLLYKLVTPPLPLPYKGGELLPPTYPQALPSLVGEGQGWGQYFYNLYLLSNDSKSLLQSYYKKIKQLRESAILFLIDTIRLTLSPCIYKFANDVEAVY